MAAAWINLPLNSVNVYELFVAGKGKTFTAKPKPDAEIASLLAKRSSCGKDTLYFSLRYLPVAHGILEY